MTDTRILPPHTINILITRLQNIGDMLAFIPALRLLRQAVPDARITLLCKHAGGIEIIRDCPYYNDMIVIKDRSFKEKFRLIREFRKRKLDYFIISPQDRGRVPWALMGGAKKIVAFKEIKECGIQKKEKLSSCIDVCPLYDPQRTETENCAMLVTAFCQDCGIPFPQPANLTLEYSWTKLESRQKVERLLKTSGLRSDKYFVLAPFSAKRDAKNWRNKEWLELSAWLHEQYGCDIVIVGGKAEAEFAEFFNQTQNRPVIHNLCGQTSLDETCVLLEKAVGFVGLDSGPAFLASAAEIPAVVLYGPGDIGRWHPPQTTAPRINIYHPQTCSPCRHKICPNNSLCMNAISLTEVKTAVSQCLQTKTTNNIQEKQP